MSWAKLSGVLAVVGFIALLGVGLKHDPNEIPSPLIGRAAPEFDLPTLKSVGDSLDLADLRGKPVLVNFWASWCVPCIQEHASLVRAWNRWGATGQIAMVGIVYQDSPENAKRFLRERGGGWDQLVDPGSRTSIDFGVYGVPETFFVDARGRIVQKQVGAVDDQILATRIGALLAEGGAGKPSPSPAAADQATGAYSHAPARGEGIQEPPGGEGAP